jgi:hypothetical protein
MTLPPGGNPAEGDSWKAKQLCLCGSGKTYEKCCLRRAHRARWLSALPALIAIFAVLSVLALYAYMSAYSKFSEARVGPWASPQQRLEISSPRPSLGTGAGPPGPTHFTQFPDPDVQKLLSKVSPLARREATARLNAEPCPCGQRRTVAHCLTLQDCRQARGRALEIIREVEAQIRDPRLRTPTRGQEERP